MAGQADTGFIDPHPMKHDRDLPFFTDQLATVSTRESQELTSSFDAATWAGSSMMQQEVEAAPLVAKLSFAPGAYGGFGPTRRNKAPST